MSFTRSAVIMKYS